MTDPIVIIGTGVAGYTLAKELRKLDQQVSMVLITADDGANYSKPMLSNALSKGKTAQQLQLASAEKMAETLAATILTSSTVKAINPTEKTVELTNSESIRYSKLVLATGASPRKLALNGNGQDAVLSVNSLTDYRRFRDQLSGAQHVTIIGPGLIGCEFANDLLTANINVSIIGPSALPMMHFLPTVISQQLQSSLAEQGAEWHLNTAIESLDSAQSRFKVSLANGHSFLTDFVLSSAGLVANTQLAQVAGLKTHHGIIVNELLQTSEQDIYALGDCAEINGQLHMYIAPILASARALANTLLGTATKLVMPIMPVVVKTPICPIVIQPAPYGANGQWVVDETAEDGGLIVRFIDNNNTLLGFALSGTAITLKQQFVKQLAV